MFVFLIIILIIETNKKKQSLKKKVFGGSSMLSTEGMGPYPLAYEDMGPYPLAHEDMGPYPLTDHSNLLGPSNYVGMSSGRMNYGTNSPMPLRRLVPERDSYRRHSAHGRITTAAGTYYCFVKFYSPINVICKKKLLLLT